MLRPTATDRDDRRRAILGGCGGYREDCRPLSDARFASTAGPADGPGVRLRQRAHRIEAMRERLGGVRMRCPFPVAPPSARSGPAGAFPDAKGENHVDRPRPWHQAEGGHPAFEAGEPGRIRISSMTGITAARGRIRAACTRQTRRLGAERLRNLGHPNSHSPRLSLLTDPRPDRTPEISSPAAPGTAANIRHPRFNATRNDSSDEHPRECGTHTKRPAPAPHATGVQPVFPGPGNSMHRPLPARFAI